MDTLAFFLKKAHLELVNVVSPKGPTDRMVPELAIHDRCSLSCPCGNIMILWILFQTQKSSLEVAEKRSTETMTI